MCKKKNVGLGVGLALLGCGAAIGAILVKKQYDKRKDALKRYNIEVDRLQSEVDFDYSEEFLKELKQETINANKKNNRDDLMKAFSENKEAVRQHIEKLENILKEHIKRETDKKECDGQIAIEEVEADASAEVAEEIIIDDSDFEE